MFIFYFHEISSYFKRIKKRLQIVNGADQCKLNAYNIQLNGKHLLTISNVKPYEQMAMVIVGSESRTLTHRIINWKKCDMCVGYGIRYKY